MLSIVDTFRISVVFLLLSSLGCGQSNLPLGKVSGRVSLHGKPVAEGTVLFVPEKGPMASGALDAQGHYTLTTKSPGDGAVLGRHRVTVAPVTTGAALEPGKPLAPSPAKFPSNIPVKFQNAKTSGLSADVRSGGNTFDYDLTP